MKALVTIIFSLCYPRDMNNLSASPFGFIDLRTSRPGQLKIIQPRSWCSAPGKELTVLECSSPE